MHRQVVLEGILLLLDFPLDSGHVSAQARRDILHIASNVAQFEHLGQRGTYRTDFHDVLIGNAVASDFVNQLDHAAYFLVFVVEGAY